MTCGECGGPLEYAGTNHYGDWGCCADPSLHGDSSALYLMNDAE